MSKFAGVASDVDGGELVNFSGARRRFREGSVCRVGAKVSSGLSTLCAQGPGGLTRAADIAGAEEEEDENNESKCQKREKIHENGPLPTRNKTR